jgi:hypothetical protein
MNDAPACPRCGNAFHCGANDATPCACTLIRLGASALTELRARYETCVCLKCLAEIADRQEGRPDLAIGRP